MVLVLPRLTIKSSICLMTILLRRSMLFSSIAYDEPSNSDRNIPQTMLAMQPGFPDAMSTHDQTDLWRIWPSQGNPLAHVTPPPRSWVLLEVSRTRDYRICIENVLLEDLEQPNYIYLLYYIIYLFLKPHLAFEHFYFLAFVIALDYKLM